MTLDGTEALLAIRIGGDLVGEMSALDDRPHPANGLSNHSRDYLDDLVSGVPTEGTADLR